MGTFHEGKGELHGITVVVDTVGPEVYVGRCDEVRPEGVVLLDGDRHEEGAGGKSKADWVSAASRFGVWKKFERFVVPAEQVASVRRLGDL